MTSSLVSIVTWGDAKNASELAERVHEIIQKGTISAVITEKRYKRKTEGTVIGWTITLSSTAANVLGKRREDIEDLLETQRISNFEIRKLSVLEPSTSKGIYHHYRISIGYSEKYTITDIVIWFTNLLKEIS